MRQALLRLREDIVEAVQQDDARFLVVPCTDAELPYAVHAVSAYQEAFPQDFIVSFTTPFEDADDWFERTVSALRQVLAVTPDLPQLPASLLDRAHPLDGRMNALVAALDGLFLAHERGRVVLSLLPSSVSNWESYARVVSSLLPHRSPSARLRCFIRDELQATLANALAAQQIPFVEVAFDFTPAGVERHLAEEVVDASLSTPERMQSLLQLASLDMAHRRHALAAERFHLLIPYFARAGNYASSALSHLCLVEVAIAAERNDLARLHGLHALRDALKGNAIPVLLNAAAALARLEEREQRWLQAAAMYQSAATLASSYLHMQAAGDHHYDAGRCSWKGQSFAAGYDAWNRALRIAQQGQDWSRVIRVLEALEVALAPTNLEAHKAQITGALSLARSAQCGTGCTHTH